MQSVKYSIPSMILLAICGALLSGWPVTTGNEISSSPAVANEVVYVGSDDSNLYAFNATCEHCSMRAAFRKHRCTTLESQHPVANAAFASYGRRTPNSAASPASRW